MSFLRDLVSLRSLENPSRPLTDSSLLDVLGGEPTEAGVTVTEETSLNIITVLRGVQLISGTVAGLPLKAYSVEDKQRRPALVLDDPSPGRTPFEVWETLVSHMVLWGNAYCFKRRNGAGQVVSLKTLHPSRVKVEAEDGQPIGREWVKRFTIDGQHHFTTREILHVPCLSLDGLTGLSPVGYVREALGIARAGDKAAGGMLGRGLMLSGVLQTDQELEQEQAEALKRRWQAKYGGVGRVGDVAILDRGAKFQPLAMPPADAQFLESRKFQVTEIARWLGIPGWLLNDQEKSTSWGTGMEQQFTTWVMVGLKPYLQRIEQRVTAELLNPATEYAEFAVEGLLRGDSKSRAAFYASGITHGWMVPNEARAKENLQPVEWGDRPYLPHNTPAELADNDPDTKPAGEDDDDDDE